MSDVKILIAEDNDALRKMMTVVLENEGHQILQAADGGAARKVLSDNEIHLCLVDLHMVPEGGFEFLNTIRQEDNNIPVIIITGDESSDLLIELQKLDVLRLLKKPVEPEQLKKIVNLTLKKIGISS